MADEVERKLWQHIDGGMGVLRSLALLAFMASAPILLPNIDLLHSELLSLDPSIETALLDSSPFLWTMSLSAMFTALAVLFVCLLEPSFGGFRKGLVVVGGGAYLLGYGIFVISMVFDFDPVLVSQVAGVPLGSGLVVVGMAWMLQVHLPDYRHAIILLTVTVLAMSLLDLVYCMMPPAVGLWMMLMMALIGTVGCEIGYLRSWSGGEKHHASGSNWWDVFGHLDMSLLDSDHEYERPISRVLFFVISPSIMLLLLLSSRNMPTDGLTLPFSIIASILACLCAVPLCAVTEERILVSFSYRLYLPIVAFAVFIIDAFVPAGTEPLTMSIGIGVFCVLYAMLLSSVLVGIASRMDSLALPMMGILVIALSLVTLLSYTRVHAGQLSGIWFYITMALFVISIVLFIVTPSSKIWRGVMAGVSAANEKDEAASLIERCDRIAADAGLTARESEILRYLARGHGSAFIAADLVVAESTVRTHVKSIYRKIGVSSREELLELIDAKKDDVPSDEA